jgi:hypothetical protein
LPPAEEPLRFALLRAWLKWCDESHHCTEYNDHEYYDKPNKGLPKRLLCVGNPTGSDYNPDILRLVDGQQILAGKYVALSHCWGEHTIDSIDPEKDFRTIKANRGSREKGFRMAGLPKTFQDAIKVTRELHVPYLWIDSFCIVQDDEEEWKRESARMEDVYTSAYCTIAATSAVDSNAGFLKRNITGEYVYIQDDSGRQVYVCSDIANFDDEVEEAQLNTRAWVMQERLLSCRTIHFGANQMYWECGEGIYCEDLTQLKR